MCAPGVYRENSGHKARTVSHVGPALGSIALPCTTMTDPELAFLIPLLHVECERDKDRAVYLELSRVGWAGSSV